MADRLDPYTRREAAAYLATAREQAGFTQRQAAEQLQIDPSQISRWERGTNLPSPARAAALATLYRIDHIDLLNKIVVASFEENTALRREVGTARRDADRTLDRLEQIIERWTVAVEELETRQERPAPGG